MKKTNRKRLAYRIRHPHRVRKEHIPKKKIHKKRCKYGEVLKAWTVIAFFIIYYVGRLAYIYFIYYKIVHDGIIVKAVITAKIQRPTARSYTSPSYVVEYELDGKTYEADSQQKSFKRQEKIGDSVTIAIWPGNHNYYHPVYPSEQ